MSSYDLANPPKSVTNQQHKLKQLVQAPKSQFMDVKCPGCFQISVVFTHATSQVVCQSCAQVLATSTGGKAKLAPGCSFRMKE